MSTDFQNPRASARGAVNAPKSCPTGKVPLDAQRAQHLARRSSARNERAMTHYRCAECGARHLGSPSRPYRLR